MICSSENLLVRIAAPSGRLVPGLAINAWTGFRGAGQLCDGCLSRTLRHPYGALERQPHCQSRQPYWTVRRRCSQRGSTGAMCNLSERTFRSGLSPQHGLVVLQTWKSCRNPAKALAGVDGKEPERWTAKRKVAVIMEVLKGTITVAETCCRYGFTLGEYQQWVDRFMQAVFAGLTVQLPSAAGSRHDAESGGGYPAIPLRSCWSSHS
jgi:hypothetical protein